MRTSELYQGSIKALSRLYQGSIQALLRLYSGSIKALSRLYSAPVKKCNKACEHLQSEHGELDIRGLISSMEV
jgi:hypothetical protein